MVTTIRQLREQYRYCVLNNPDNLRTLESSGYGFIKCEKNFDINEPYLKIVESRIESIDLYEADKGYTFDRLLDSLKLNSYSDKEYHITTNDVDKIKIDILNGKRIKSFNLDSNMEELTIEFEEEFEED